MAGNDAEGKAPSIAEEMAKFQGFSVKDGEVDSGNPTDAEKAAALANSSTHQENVARGAAPAPKEGDKTPVELTAAEEEAAIAAAREAAGEEELSEEDKDKAVAAALAEKSKPAPKTPKDRSPSARIAQARRLQGDAERRANALEAENAALRAAALGKGPAKETPLTDGAKSAKSETPGKPDPTDTTKYEFGSMDEKYIADMTRWTLRDEQRIMAEENASKTLSTAEAEAKATFDAAVSAFDEAGFAEFGDDFQEVIDSRELPKDDPDYWPLSPTLAALLLESEKGPAIAKELASNPKEARRINKLGPERQAAWFGVKEEKLLANSGAGAEENEEGDGAAARQTAPQTPKPKESKAPVPLPSARKLNGHGGNRVPNEATPDFAAFEAQAMAASRK